MSNEATIILRRLGEGDPAAASALLPLVYEELRALAGSHFRRQRADHTLQPTALVHEAFIRLIDYGPPAPEPAEGGVAESGGAGGTGAGKWRDRAHFFAVAATAMRQILTDHARRKKADKRGGEGWQRIGIENAADAEQPGGDIDVLALDEALTKLASLDATGRRHRVVELRFFGGLSMEEIADTLGVSKSTIEGDWRAARAWLAAEMSKGA
ncbi:MAG TPA: ECF-type sigma factor [Phycisphaerales bacterium]|nr:ECF-type sigma factor [Phycisphaerales bacterium]